MNNPSLIFLNFWVKRLHLKKVLKARLDIDILSYNIQKYQRIKRFLNGSIFINHYLHRKEQPTV